MAEETIKEPTLDSAPIRGRQSGKVKNMTPGGAHLSQQIDDAIDQHMHTTGAYPRFLLVGSEIKMPKGQFKRMTVLHTPDVPYLIRVFR